MGKKESGKTLSKLSQVTTVEVDDCDFDEDSGEDDERKAMGVEKINTTRGAKVGLLAKQSTVASASTGSKSKDLESFKKQIKTSIQKPPSNPPSA